MAKSRNASDSRFAGIGRLWREAGPTVRLSGRDATLTLVTDGVSDRLSDDAVAQILRDTCPEPHLGPKALLVAALDAGADDNVCALVVYLNRHP